MFQPDPASAGFDSARLKRIDQLLDEYADSKKLPGFVTLISRNNHVGYLRACGDRDIESGTPYGIDTLFRIYSMTKPITSAALLMLMEEGRFRLDDPIADVLPAFSTMQVYHDGELRPASKPISYRHLLTHTAGLSYGSLGGIDPGYVDQQYDEADLFNFKKHPTLEDAVTRIADLPLRYHPGEVWHYSMATDVVGRLVEVLSGKQLGDFVQERILAPLNMHDTAFEVPESKTDRLATLYQAKKDEPIKVFDHPSKSIFKAPVSLQLGGGGLISTISDYYQFCRCMLNRGRLGDFELLREDTFDEMLRNQLREDQLPIKLEFSPPFHGLGFGLGVSKTIDADASGVAGSVGDYGWGGYAETIFWIDPREQLIGINMTQCLPSGFYPIRKEFRKLVYDAVIS